MRVLAVLVGLLLFPVFSQGNDSVYVRARMVPVSDQLREGMSQSELAALVSAADKQGQDVWLEASSVVLSGKWMTARKVRDFWYPTNYSAVRLYKSKTDRGSYSIETTELSDNEFTQVIPHQPTGKMASKEIGTVLKLRPSLKSNGEVIVAGVISQNVLLGFASSSKPITLAVSKGPRKGKIKEISENADRIPMFDELEKKFSVKIGSTNGTAYVGVVFKKSLLGGDFSSMNWEQGEVDESDLDCFGKTGGETLPMVLVVSAVAVIPDQKEKPRFRHVEKKRIYVTSRFVETDVPLEIKNLIMSNQQFQLLIRRLSQQKGVDLMTAPSMMVKSAQDAKIEVGREFIFPSVYDEPGILKTEGIVSVSPSQPAKFESRNLGVGLRGRFRIADGGMIEFQASVVIDSFEGFMNFGNQIRRVQVGAFGKPSVVAISENRIRSPVFPSRSSSTSVTIPSGYTVALTGMADMVREGTTSGNKAIFKKIKSKEIRSPRYITVFLTATLMDESGVALQR